MQQCCYSAPESGGAESGAELNRPLALSFRVQQALLFLFRFSRTTLLDFSMSALRHVILN